MKDYSQYGEQEHILHVFDVLGIAKGHLVDLGASDGYTMSNSRALLEKGWTGDLYDGDPKGAKDVTKQWITKDSVKALLDCRCKFLSLDLDGNDYWILKAILETTAAVPDLIVCEINPIFQRDEAVVMPYNAAHVWDGTTYYGASLAAFERLVAPHGYKLIYLHHSLNAFFLWDDPANPHPELVREIDYQVKVNHRPHTPDKTWQRL